MTFKATNIQTLEHLFILSQAIHDFLKMEVSDEIEGCIKRGHELTAYMANTGKMLADAKYHRDQEIRNSALLSLKDSKRCGLPASTLNELIKADCKEINYLVNWIEQLDKEAKYQLEWLRTVVSKQKEEMRMSQFTNQTY